MSNLELILALIGGGIRMYVAADTLEQPRTEKREFIVRDGELV